MNHKPEIGFVDAHPEGVGRNDDRRLPAAELVLHTAADIGLQARVIQARPPPADLRHDRRQLLAPLASRTIDDARAGRLLQHRPQRVILVDLAHHVLHLETEIRPGEAGDAGQRLAEPQLLGDVGLHIGRGGSREGDRLRIAQLLAKSAEPCIIGPKIVTPLADAMGLIDGQELYLRLPELFEEQRAAEPLGGDIDQVVLAGRHLVHPLKGFSGRERAVDAGRGDAPLRKTIDLVLHQGD
uniref:Uncharacterized protein n=1 Tax=uncultured organism TaxID=155900 RepID=W0NUI0_9ZZZZ|nr:hypothetical protein META_00031 [uncultured organism]